MKLLFHNNLKNATRTAPKRGFYHKILSIYDDPLYGKQEGRFFQGYYKIHCYLPLYIFCGEQLLCAKLNTAEREGAHGAKEELERIINQIKREWPEVRIIVRGDSGFCRDKIMNWCEENEVWFVVRHEAYVYRSSSLPRKAESSPASGKRVLGL